MVEAVVIVRSSELVGTLANGFATSCSVAWLVVFGIFGKLIFSNHALERVHIARMRLALWLDIADDVLWFVTAVGGIVRFRKERRGGAYGGGGGYGGGEYYEGGEPAY